MTVNELIQQLQAMPPGAEIRVMGHDGTREPHPSQEWHDHAENYIVLL